jgi:Bacterial regulatory helix-turn-helix protein, lysR family
MRSFLARECGKIWNAAIKDQCYNRIGYIEPDIGNIAMAETERIERRLKLHDLRVLMSVVQHGSMVKAAERLATSQPAISRAIADLEHSFGVRLLDRGPRGIVPTPYGPALIKRSVTVFDELRFRPPDINRTFCARLCQEV